MPNGSNGLKYTVAFFGRIFFAVYFIVNGLNSIFSFDAIVQSLPNVTYAHGLLITLTVLQLLGGALVIIGWYTRFGAFVLFAAVVIMTWFEFLVIPYHVGTMPAAIATFMNFIDNLAFAGATLYIMAYGAGGASIDQLRYRRRMRPSM